MAKKSPITSRIIETKLLKWKEFQFIQDDTFKEFSKEASDKLKASMFLNHFTQPFYVWFSQSENVHYCLDGFHRIKALKELEEEKYEIPEELPATLVECADKKEAARMVLLYSSMYAKVTAEGFLSFIESYEFDAGELSDTIDLPGLEMMPEIAGPPMDPFEDAGVISKNQYGVIAMCENEAEQEKVFNQLVELGYKCKVVVT